jgi:hypothetical protein
MVKSIINFQLRRKVQHVLIGLVLKRIKIISQIVMALKNCVVRVWKAVLHTWQDSLNAHQGDLVFDPVVEEVQNVWPNGLEFILAGCFTRYLHQFKVHCVGSNGTSGFQRLSNNLDRNEHFARSVQECVARSDGPLNLLVGIPHVLVEDDWLTRQFLVRLS